MTTLFQMTVEHDCAIKLQQKKNQHRGNVDVTTAGYVIM